MLDVFAKASVQTSNYACIYKGMLPSSLCCFSSDGSGFFRSAACTGMPDWFCGSQLNERRNSASTQRMSTG